MKDTEQVRRGVARTPWDALVVRCLMSGDGLTRWMVLGLRQEDTLERSCAARTWASERNAQRKANELIARRQRANALYDNYKWDR